MKTEPESWASLIRRKRAELELRQVELAEKVHTTQPTVSGWERGLGVPSSAMQARLIAVLEISPEELHRAIAGAAAASRGTAATGTDQEGEYSMPQETLAEERRRRCELARPVLDRLNTPLLDDLRERIDERDAWEEALTRGLSGGERVALHWLAARVWLGEMPSTVTGEEVVAACDRDLVSLLADVQMDLTMLAVA